MEASTRSCAVDLNPEANTSDQSLPRLHRDIPRRATSTEDFCFHRLVSGSVCVGGVCLDCGISSIGSRAVASIPEALEWEVTAGDVGPGAA